MTNNNGQNKNDEIEIVTASGIQWEMKRGSCEIVGAWPDGHYVAAKDFDEQLQMRAHAIVTQQKHKII
jgi:hypothetical protein